MKRTTVNWERVAAILRAQNPDDIVRCPYCSAQGVVPYVAEHVLTAHRTSRIGATLVSVIAGSDRPS